MTNPKILVTGATGRTGGAVVTQLLAKGWPVRAVVRVAVAALLDPTRHAGKSYRPTGPKLLSVTEMVAIIGCVVGHQVRHVRTPLWMFYKAAKAQGQEPILLSGLRHYFQDHDRGAFAIGAPNDTVRELTGKEAENFETITRRHAALPECHQSFSARLAAFARFMAVPILPGFDPVAYDRAQEQPVPPAPRLALDDTDWAASHGAEPATTHDPRQACISRTTRKRALPLIIRS